MDGGNSHKLELSLLGGMRWRFGQHDLPVTNKKLCALVAFLAMNDATRLSRERLVGVLWSDSDEQNARASLRQTIKQLRTLVEKTGFTGFSIGRENIEIQQGSFVIEIKDIVKRLDHLIVDDRLLGKGNICEGILSGYEDIDPNFRVWLLTTRQNIYSSVLSLAEARFSDPKLNISLRTKFARTIVNLDPTHEPACRYLMLKKADEGDVAGALKIYNELWNLLRDEYDMEPSEQTIDVVAGIKLGNHRLEQAPQGSLPQSHVSSPQTSYIYDVATLPIINVEQFEDSGIPKFMFHLVRGFRHSLIDSIARFREWKVADDLDLSSHDVSIPKVAYSLEGTAYIADETLNLVLTMKDLNTRILIWSDRFHYAVDDWPNIKHRVLSKIAMTLNVNLSAKKLSEMLTVGGVSKKTYEQWLFGQSLIMNFTPESWQQSEKIFRELTEISPNFSSAYSSLAQLGNTRHIAQPGVFATNEEQASTLRTAQLSAQIDPFDSRSHLSLAWAYAFSGHFDQSYPHFEMSIELNEFDPWTVISAAQGFAFLGDKKNALRFSRLSMDMAFLPSPPYWGYHAGINFMCGDYKQALDTAARAGDALVNNGMWRAASHLQMGAKEDAKSELRSCIELIQRRWVGHSAPDQEAVINWMTQLFPIQALEDRARLHDVFALADGHWLDTVSDSPPLSMHN